MVVSTVTKTKTKRDGLYIHPRDSITKPTKVSCASCISGHRSGACDHYDRILLQIRAAGRPSTTCHHQSSCGGACLQQKAFIIPGEAPQWCREHQSCIENWEPSDRCPPYPVSSTKSAKRKERSNSPQVPTVLSPSLPSSNTSHMSHGATSSVSQSTCASEHGRTGTLSSLPSATQVFSAAPSMIKASNPSPTTPWISPGIGDHYHPDEFHGYPTHQMLPHMTPTISVPQTSFTETSTINSLGVFDMPSSQGQHEPWKPAYDPFSVNFNFDPPETPHGIVSPARSNPFSSSGLVSLAPTSYIPAAASPFRQRSNPRQKNPQQTHPCPGNGFQCPCDEDCICQDCYTHGRGFWTLPFSFTEIPHEDCDPSPLHIAMPPSTFPEVLQTHSYPHHDDFGSPQHTNGNGENDANQGALEHPVFRRPKGSCCAKSEHEDWQV